ncbi:hypothetical protein L1049_002776 [Liquidambar formosana]|uniref:Uncharacterized protein n=1 Tax=Liquidambar formosana TaxID=63359 RepID=A0AAP0NKY1_LIQFO
MGFLAASSSIGRRRIMLSSLAIMLTFSIFQVLICCNGMVEAIRITKEENKWATTENESKYKKNIMNDKEELFSKFFNGGALDPNKTQRGFQEIKRKVPTCPDPLHNK